MMDFSGVVRIIPTPAPFPFDAPSTFKIHPFKMLLCGGDSWCELGNEVRQDLPFDRCPQFKGDSEVSDFCDPLGDSVVSLRILHNGLNRYSISTMMGKD